METPFHVDVLAVGLERHVWELSLEGINGVLPNAPLSGTARVVLLLHLDANRLPAAMGDSHGSAVLVTQGDPGELRTAAMLGISAFLHPDDAAHCLREALCAAACHQSYYSPALFEPVTKSLRTLGASPESSDESLRRLLSDREAQVAYRASVCRENKRIARELGIDELTVKWHLGNVYSKLGLSGRRDLRPLSARLKTLLPPEDPG